MGRAPLHLAGFGGGVVITGAADQRKTDEVFAADSLEIGSRGALVAASDFSDYVTIDDGQVVPAPWTRLWALLSAMPGFDQSRVLAIGEGIAQDLGGNPFGPAYLLRSFARSGEASPVLTPQVIELAVVIGMPPPAPSPEGVIITGFAWPGV